MKFHRLLLGLACVAALLTACDPEENNGKKETEVTLSVNVTSLSFGYGGGAQEISVTSNSNWTADVKGDSFHIDKRNGSMNGTIKVTCDVAKQETTETGSVVIKAKDITCTVNLTRDGSNPDRAAMMDLYNSLGGSKLKNMDNWGSSATLDKWLGVALDNEGRVKEINIGWYNESNMNFYNVQGRLPESIGDLSHLEHLSISYEEGFTGNLPDSFFNLKNLKRFGVYKCNMTGSLKEKFDGLASLISISLVNMAGLNGPLPKSLGKCPNLEKISLSNCSFEGPLPEEWCNLDLELNLNGNYLTSPFPANFYTMPKAWYNFEHCYYQSNEYIDISNAPKIKGRHPFELGETQVYDLVDNSTFNFLETIKANKYTVQLFWATWCGFSKSLAPKLVSFYKKYHSKGLEVIAFDPYENSASHGSGGDTKEEQDAIALKEILSNGFDIWKNYSLAKNPGYNYPMSLPSAVVYDSEGNIVFSDEPIPDPRYKRFGKNTTYELIPFLETLFGPAN